MIALLPGFISPEYSRPQQLAAFLSVMLPSEFLFMSLYASGGAGLRRLLSNDKQLARLNKISATLMVFVAALVLTKL
jgi:threonine/homoserine/homoserine lactone efflux protein